MQFEQPSLGTEVVLMKAKTGILATLVCAFAFVFAIALVGCSGGGGDSENYDKNFVGTWELSGLEEDGTSYAESDIKMLKSMGLAVSLTMNEDKTAALDYFGEKLEGTWEAKNATTVTLKAMGDSMDIKLNNGELTVEVDGAKMMFKKAES